MNEFIDDEEDPVPIRALTTGDLPDTDTIHNLYVLHRRTRLGIYVIPSSDSELPLWVIIEFGGYYKALHGIRYDDFCVSLSADTARVLERHVRQSILEGQDAKEALGDMATAYYRMMVLEVGEEID